MTDLILPRCTRCHKDGHRCERIVEESFVSYVPRSRQDRLHKLKVIKPRTVLSPHIAPVLDEQVWLAHLQHNIPSSMFNFFLVDSHADSLAQRSLRALSCSFFGRLQHSTKVACMGNEIYLNCLREINTRLADPHLCTSTDILLAVSVFGFYEVRLGMLRDPTTLLPITYP